MLWIWISRVVGSFMITGSWIVAMIYFLPSNWVIVGLAGQAIVFGSIPIEWLLRRRENTTMTLEEREEHCRVQSEKDKKALDDELEQLAKAHR